MRRSEEEVKELCTEIAKELEYFGSVTLTKEKGGKLVECLLDLLEKMGAPDLSNLGYACFDPRNSVAYQPLCEKIPPIEQVECCIEDGNIYIKHPTGELIRVGTNTLLNKVDSSY